MSSGGSSSGLTGAGGRIEVASDIAAAVIADPRACHGQDEVVHQGGVEPDLVVVQTELVFAKVKILFHGPAHARDRDRDRDQGARCDGIALGNVAVEVGLIGGAFEVSADEQVVPRAGGGAPGPRVAPVSFRPWPARGPVPRCSRYSAGEAYRAGSIGR